MTRAYNRDRGVQQPEAVRLPVIDRRRVMAAYDELPPAVRLALRECRCEPFGLVNLRRALREGELAEPDALRSIRNEDEASVAINSYALYGPAHPDARFDMSFRLNPFAPAAERPSLFELYLFGYVDLAERLYAEEEARNVAAGALEKPVVMGVEEDDGFGPVTSAQCRKIRAFGEDGRVQDPVWRAALFAKFQVRSPQDLRTDQADSFIAWLEGEAVA